MTSDPNADELADLMRQITAAERDAAPGPRPPLDLPLAWRILRAATKETDLRITLGVVLTEVQRVRRANYRAQEEIAGLREERAQLLAERNRLARECADLRDTTDAARKAERERIANWFEGEGALWRTKNGADSRCEYDIAADLIREALPDVS